MGNNGFLVEIKSQSQEEMILDHWLGLIQDGDSHGFWLGLHDLEGIYHTR